MRERRGTFYCASFLLRLLHGSTFVPSLKPSACYPNVFEKVLGRLIAAIFVCFCVDSDFVVCVKRECLSRRF